MYLILAVALRHSCMYEPCELVQVACKYLHSAWLLSAQPLLMCQPEDGGLAVHAIREVPVLGTCIGGLLGWPVGLLIAC